ncbi:hypothetical protein FSP39_017424, partial [Pinctada imbricata]
QDRNETTEQNSSEVQETEADENVSRDDNVSSESHSSENRVENEEESSPAVVPTQERPVRNRRQPAWMRTGEFVVGQQVVVDKDDWKEKVNELKHFSMSNPNAFQGIESKLGEAFLNILTSK